MIKRIWKRESPVPSFGECSADGSSHGMDVISGFAAKIKNTNPTRYVLGSKCVKREHNDAGASNTTNTSPANCVGTYRFVQTFQNGVALSDMLFFRARK